MGPKAGVPILWGRDRSEADGESGELREEADVQQGGVSGDCGKEEQVTFEEYVVTVGRESGMTPIRDALEKAWEAGKLEGQREFLAAVMEVKAHGIIPATGEGVASGSVVTGRGRGDRQA